MLVFSLASVRHAQRVFDFFRCHVRARKHRVIFMFLNKAASRFGLLGLLNLFELWSLDSHAFSIHNKTIQSTFGI